MSGYDYVAVGHVTCDLIDRDDGGQLRQPGGTAFYSALQAARLGSNALIVTQGVPAEIEQLLSPYNHEVGLHVIPASQTTTLATRGAGHGRSQRVLAWAGAIVNPPTIEAGILHLAPVARETPSSWRGPAGFVGVTPQGLVREWPSGEVRPTELDPALLPNRFDAAVISEQERRRCAPLFAAADAGGACVAVTAGARPASIHLRVHDRRRALRRCAPHPVEARDDLGAGDVFAAAFFTALAEGREPLAAASFAHAAAATRIAGVGPNAIGTRAQIDALA